MGTFLEKIAKKLEDFLKENPVGIPGTISKEILGRSIKKFFDQFLGKPLKIHWKKSKESYEFSKIIPGIPAGIMIEFFKLIPVLKIT